MYETISIYHNDLAIIQMLNKAVTFAEHSGNSVFIMHATTARDKWVDKVTKDSMKITSEIVNRLPF